MPHKRRKTRSAAFTPEALECRTLLTTMSLQSSGQLLIQGSEGADRVEVSQVGTRIKVSVQGQANRNFDADEVNSIRFEGNKGKDYFRNRTSLPSVAHGNGGHDTLIGGSSNDKLYGHNGRDDLRGGPGDDTLVGYSGDDVLRGNGGADVLSGGADDDTLLGGRGPDRMAGFSGSDVLRGGTSNDEMYGGSGADLMEGGDHHDIMLGGDGNDTMAGNSGDDELVGEDGNDVLNGGDGADSLYGSDGEDTLDGGGFDNDRDYLRGGSDTDVFHQWGLTGDDGGPRSKGWKSGEDDLDDFNGFHDSIIFHMRPKWRDLIVGSPFNEPVVAPINGVPTPISLDAAARAIPLASTNHPVSVGVSASDAPNEIGGYRDSMSQLEPVFEPNNDVFFARILG